MATTIQATVTPQQDQIELLIADEEQQAQFRLDMYEVVHLLAAISKALHDVPIDRKIELIDQQPSLRASPSYQVATSEAGDLVLIFQAFPLPPFHFTIDDDRAAALSSAIGRVLQIPRSARHTRLQ